MDSPNSDLSDYASDYFPDDVKGRRLSYEHTPDHEPSGRPSKRPRLNMRAISDPPAIHNIPPVDGDGDISEDTDGSVPASPHHPGMSADDDYGQEQVTVCKWDGCDVGDVENMDNLVEHLHEDHIGTRQKKYSCEWSDCTRKGIPHASGYALRAHMRSHTREKPFYCTLPECDRSFTRSDALAKHMRTVHETEALRPSDPVPKHHSSNPSNRFQRLRLVLNERQKQEKGSTPASPSQPPGSATVPALAITPVPSVAAGPMGPINPMTADAEYAHNNIIYMQDLGSPNMPTMVQFPPDMNFTPDELLLPAPELFKLLRRQLHWATQEGEQLRTEADILEKQRKDEWYAKELVMENYMEAELATTRRKRLDAGLYDEPDTFKMMEGDIIPSKKLEVQPKLGKLPWWREKSWVTRQAEVNTMREGMREGIREGMAEREMPGPELREDDLRPGQRQEDMRQEPIENIPMPDFPHERPVAPEAT
ncbi:hypothetical protein K504DRAFT_412500 [Pleomassaria siparia CBS 279.74]|uniref:C2H2-type domain-containing protein n=1 Tax=Pleomassaria siparia CBS 279.74 TaxID=1314801 RepID=A0A6G1K2A5_9PLEO|nr:hypothetical protein K504DRAFT_412500 [Pleomassaria siparia CBS 279.74]